jgi:hypothetical protein
MTSSTLAARTARVQRTPTTCRAHTGATAAPHAALPARSPLGRVALPVHTRRAHSLVARATEVEPEVRTPVTP